MASCGVKCLCENGQMYQPAVLKLIFVRRSEEIRLICALGSQIKEYALTAYWTIWLYPFHERLAPLNNIIALRRSPAASCNNSHLDSRYAASKIANTPTTLFLP